MRAEMTRMALALALLMPCAGCMWGRVRMNDASVRERALNIREGVTRADELATILKAEPTMRMPLKDRTVMSYTYADTKSNGLMLLVVNFMKTQTVADTVYVEVGADGIVQRVVVPQEREVKWEFWPFD